MGKIKYKTYDCCNQQLPDNSEFFTRYSKLTYIDNIPAWSHNTCRTCEQKQKWEDTWKDGKLKCKICNQYLPTSSFDIKDSSNTLRKGYDTRCKSCKKLQGKNYRKSLEGEEALNATITARWLGARDRAKNKKISFEITKQDLKNLWHEQKGLCAISKIPMTYIMENGRTFTNLSVDRKNPHIGYTKDNVQLVCMAVNQMKSDLSKEELLMFCKAIVENN